MYYESQYVLFYIYGWECSDAQMCERKCLTMSMWTHSIRKSKYLLIVSRIVIRDFKCQTFILEILISSLKKKTIVERNEEKDRIYCLDMNWIYHHMIKHWFCFKMEIIKQKKNSQQFIEARNYCSSVINSFIIGTFQNIKETIPHSVECKGAHMTR